jgi:hypothetical protein
MVSGVPVSEANGGSSERRSDGEAANRSERGLVGASLRGRNREAGRVLRTVSQPGLSPHPDIDVAIDQP